MKSQDLERPFGGRFVVLRSRRSTYGKIVACSVCLLVSLWGASPASAAEPQAAASQAAVFENSIRPLVRDFCLTCHSTEKQEGKLDLQRFTSVEQVKRHPKVWQQVQEQLAIGEMPPKDAKQLSADQKRELVTWVQSFLDAEARARTGDPGHLPLRRLSNAEYDATIRDLTGVDLRPTREFPRDGAGGEGFTNAGESLTDISPVLFARYLSAAKEIADHAVLMPDGFRFSPSKTRRDWSDEATAQLRKYYARIWPTKDGSLAGSLKPYLQRTVKHREALSRGKFDEVAAGPPALNANYLRTLWQTLNDKTQSEPLDSIRAKWRKALESGTDADLDDVAAEVKTWQAALWRTATVGDYIRSTDGKLHVQSNSVTESLSRQVPFDDPAAESATVRLAIKPAPGQSTVTVYLAARETGSAGPIIWERPRFEGAGKPTLLLRDYAEFGPAFEVSLPSVFAETAKYLSAVAELAHSADGSPEAIAEKNKLDATFLKQWVKVLAVVAQKPSVPLNTAAPALTLLDAKAMPGHGGAIRGWTKQGTDLPIVIANSSEQTLMIPGRISPHSVAVHPTPQEFVAVVWKSPLAGAISVSARVAQAHNCGNGVAWQLAHRRGDRATVLADGALDPTQESKFPAKSLKVEQGDTIVLAVDPRDANHACDLTELELTIAEQGDAKRVWDLNEDVAWEIEAGNPHADKHGQKDTWSFARGPVQKSAGNSPTSSILAGNSTIGRWRLAAADPERRAEAEELAKQVERILSGPQPGEKDVERAMYDRLVSVDSPVLSGVDVKKLAKSTLKGSNLGLPKERFAAPDFERVIESSDKVVEIQLPASLFVGREFVVDAKLEDAQSMRFVRVQASATPPDANARPTGPLLASASSAAYRQVLAGNADFRSLFPLFTCFPDIIPNDEVVTLKMFHREDEPLLRLFASAEQARELERLWTELRLISRQPVAEFEYLPTYMGFTTQDTSKAFQQFFIDRKPKFKQDADDFRKQEESLIPVQLDALVAFAEKAFRRPLQEQEKTELRTLYDTVRKKGAGHDEAFRGVLARVLTSPSFLFRVESPPPGKEPGWVSDWEMATRLSYFLWSSSPDDELRRLAAAGRLRDPQVLAAQARRMLQDPRTRSLAVEFGTQWIHVRGFDDLKEKNETLFPTFDATLRQAIYEESILFFQDLFQSDRPITHVLDADYTYLNETLAKHYGIPGVSGPEWRKVDGVRKYGRGGVLGLASVHAKQSGASRTSPVLRGNWVVETLLGEKLPRPPANVPILPDQEGTDKLTTRQMVEMHVANPSCAACHVRIDPFGFAFENFDPIGRFRLKETGGQPVDTKAKLKDGAEFEGIDGLRTYLLTKKKDAVTRLFCQRLLGYAVGRGTTLSDTTLIDQMVAECNAHDGKVSAAVLTIVRSPQFRMIRGQDAADE